MYPFHRQRAEKDTANKSFLWFFLFFITIAGSINAFLMKILKKKEINVFHTTEFETMKEEFLPTVKIQLAAGNVQTCSDLPKLSYNLLSFHIQVHSVTLFINKKFSKCYNVLYSSTSR